MYAIRSYYGEIRKRAAVLIELVCDPIGIGKRFEITAMKTVPLVGQCGAGVTIRPVTSYNFV